VGTVLASPQFTDPVLITKSPKPVRLGLARQGVSLSVTFAGESLRPRTMTQASIGKKHEKNDL
jgi:hypothetical protein